MATMASHHLLALLLVFFAVGCSTAAAATTPTPSAQTSPLVQSTCKATTYYDLCVSALAADPSSSATDLRGLCAIAVSAAAANAAAAAQAALANATSSSGGGGSVLFRRACAGKYGEARDALVEARKSVMGAAAYDYAFVDVSAAAEYPAVCQRLFRRGRMAFPADLAEMAVSLEHLCTVARDIISLLL